MKKLILAIYLGINATVIFGQNVLIDHKVYWAVHDYFIQLFIFENKIIYANDIEAIWIELPKNSYSLEKDGYWHLRINKNNYKHKEIVFIDGKYKDEYFTPISQAELEKTLLYYKNNDAIYRNLNVDEINASDYLTESIRGKDVKYAPENLFKCYFYPLDKMTRDQWNYDHIPWVEGQAGGGIGSSINIKYKQSIAAISILNGYINTLKPNLFYENNRVKKMTITDNDTKEKYEVEFKDFVYFQDVLFKRKVKDITLVIDDVYFGTKYNDTCISAIIEHGIYNKIEDYNEKETEETYEYYRTVEQVMKDFKKL